MTESNMKEKESDNDLKYYTNLLLIPRTRNVEPLKEGFQHMKDSRGWN